MRMGSRDDAGEMFVKRMDKIHKQARERLLEIQARQREKTENLVAALAGVIEAVRSDESSASKVDRIDQVFAGRGGIERLQEVCEAVQAWSNNNYFPLLGPPYKRYRYLLFRLVGALRFVSTTQNRSLLDAMAVVQTNQNRRGGWIPAGDLDFRFVTDRRWDKVGFRTRKGRPEMHWRQFEICMFTHLALELRTCDMAVVGSEQYADYRDRLLPWEECDPLLESYCSKVGLPRTAEEFVQQLRTELETTAAHVDESFPGNTAVSINKDGGPVLRRPAANKPPVSAMELEAALQTLLPERSLLDIVWLTNVSTRFTRHFGPISGLDAKLDQIDEKYCAAVFVMDSSMGVTQGARHMRGLVTSPTLASCLSRLPRLCTKCEEEPDLRRGSGRLSLLPSGRFGTATDIPPLLSRVRGGSRLSWAAIHVQSGIRSAGVHQLFRKAAGTGEEEAGCPGEGVLHASPDSGSH